MTFRRPPIHTLVRNLVAPTLLSTLTLLQAHAAPRYEVSTVGSTLEPFMRPIMNNIGSVAGVSNSQLAIFQNGTTTPVGLPAGTTQGFAQDFNDQGVVLGYAERQTLVGGSVAQAGFFRTDNQQQFLYQNGQMTNMQQIIGMPYLSTGAGPSAMVMGLNNRGELAGTIAPLDRNASQAFVYRDGQVQSIATPDTWSALSAYAINNQGVVVGRYELHDPGKLQVQVGVFMDDHGKLTDLGTLTNGRLLLKDFNDKGQILFETETGTTLYDNGHFTKLNTFVVDQPETFFSATGLGGEGTVIGDSATEMWQRSPLMFIDGQSFDPNSLIDEQSAAQHRIERLLSINDQGDILAVDQAGQQVLLKPLSAVPEAGSFNLMASGMVLMALMRLWRRGQRLAH